MNIAPAYSCWNEYRMALGEEPPKADGYIAITTNGVFAGACCVFETGISLLMEKAATNPLLPEAKKKEALKALIRGAALEATIRNKALFCLVPAELAAVFLDSGMEHLDKMPFVFVPKREEQKAEPKSKPEPKAEPPPTEPDDDDDSLESEEEKELLAKKPHRRKTYEGSE